MKRICEIKTVQYIFRVTRLIKIIVRNRRNGDKFQPMGMNGTKKLKEYFIDKKIPKDKRNSVPIIEINGEIAAVGNRIDKRFAFRGKGIKIEFYDN